MFTEGVHSESARARTTNKVAHDVDGLGAITCGAITSRQSRGTVTPAYATDFRLS